MYYFSLKFVGWEECCLIEIIPGRGCGDDHLLVADGVFEFQAVGVERDAAVGVGARGSILEVALNWASHVGQLTPYLVVTAGVELYLQQMVTARRNGLQPIVEDGQLGTRFLGVVGDEAFVALLHTEEVVLQMAFLGRWAVLDHGKVGLVEIAVVHQGIHAGEGFAGLGKYDHATHRSVEPMDNPTEDIAGFVVTFFEECFDLLH